MKGLTLLVLFESRDPILLFNCAHTYTETQNQPTLRLTWQKVVHSEEIQHCLQKKLQALDRNKYFTSLTSPTQVRVNRSSMCESFTKPQRKPSFPALKENLHLTAFQ